MKALLQNGRAFFVGILLRYGVHDERSEVKSEPEGESDKNPETLESYAGRIDFDGSRSELIPGRTENVRHDCSRS